MKPNESALLRDRSLVLENCLIHTGNRILCFSHLAKLQCLSWLRPNGMWNHDNADRYPIYFPLLVFKCHSKSKVITANDMLLELAFSDCHPAFLRKLRSVVTEKALYVKECQDCLKAKRWPSHKAFRYCPGFLSPPDSPVRSGMLCEALLSLCYRLWSEESLIHFSYLIF